MSLVAITIVNWAKYNPRSDRANYTWFRVSNDFFTDHKLFGISDSQRLLFIAILCEASKNNMETVSVNLALLSALRGTDEKKIAEDLHALSESGVIMTANSRLSDGEPPALLPATNERTNVTNERTIRQSANVRLDALWNEHCGQLPKVREVGSKRAIHMRQRVKECSDPATWVEVIKKLAASDFCNGRVPGKTWTATFDFLLQQQTRIKALEGAYDNRTQPSGPQKLDWLVEADIALQAVRKYGSQGSEEATKELGAERMARIRKAGGFYRIGQMPSNEYTVKQLAGLLKSAHEQLTQTQEGT